MKPKELSQRLGVTVTTLQRWDRSGKLKAKRTPTNRRYYTEDQYQSIIGQKESGKRKNVIYARVSTRAQKNDLNNQLSFLRVFTNARGVIIDDVLTDIGSGLNYKRKKWNELLNQVMQSKIDTIYVAHKDRFIRFGFEWFEQFCKQFETTIVVVNNESLSPQEEVVQDLISIIHVFSCRIYGLRKYKKKIKDDDEVVKGLSDRNQTN